MGLWQAESAFKILQLGSGGHERRRADLAGDAKTQRSTSGIYAALEGPYTHFPLSTGSKRQGSIASSTMCLRWLQVTNELASSHSNKGNSVEVFLLLYDSNFRIRYNVYFTIVCILRALLIWVVNYIAVLLHMNLMVGELDTFVT